MRVATLDLGTNNCRLAIAEGSPHAPVILEQFSQITRLGESLVPDGPLSPHAKARTRAALLECAAIVEKWKVVQARCVATAACRISADGLEFIRDMRAETGLPLEIITAEEEARLAAAGAVDLLGEDAEGGMIVDIGGGSTELVFVDPHAPLAMTYWTSVPVGVVSLADQFPHDVFDGEQYETMVAAITEKVAPFLQHADLVAHAQPAQCHLIGMSGTSTALASVHLGLAHYTRDAVDGRWLSRNEVTRLITRLRSQDLAQRARHPGIGKDRADLIVPGGAILDSIFRSWPVPRMRVGDRGLREGMLRLLLHDQ
ncbi:hypothetical protein PB2503_10949 [Parvularcula bermudensis HTCC2503]|uniref:Ppx/GppA phosphatase N-terminal domain-containing protein n=1 Tax=Parvularcula bermudensis (strain ATCC BAA-594 / HTCC2503 / KCTC 12087) TaxID=314260 RepID=E0THU4_PARBH|nr:Ppx/GppA phosphatase family protein [Parvularcula bermudensis]ADM10237.1 hypothetical protein PB2503_10949 [Parvularcula bermudensis HTCC2503]